MAEYTRLILLPWIRDNKTTKLDLVFYAYFSYQSNIKTYLLKVRLLEDVNLSEKLNSISVLVPFSDDNIE